MTSPSPDDRPRFIWATRGRTWGFRFLRDGGFEDPLTAYERAFAQVEDQAEIWSPLSDGVSVARFADPNGRTDAAGRIIPHEFVLIGAWAEEIDSLEQAQRLLWGQVADEFEAAYERAAPPAPRS